MLKHIILTLFFLTIGCSQNVLNNLSSKTTDDAYLEEARKALNSKDYEKTIDILLNKISENRRAQSDVKELLASGYGGQCGLVFLEFIEHLKDQTAGSAFNIIMTAFVNVQIRPDRCLLALDVLESIGPPSQRSPNQNAFAATLGMTLMGTTLRNSADTTPSPGGDGVVDVNLCTGLSATDLDNVVLGFGHMSKNISYLTADQLGNSSENTLNQIADTCGSIAGISCQITSSADITDPIRDTVKDLMNTQEYGVGPFSTGGNDILIPGACP